MELNRYADLFLTESREHLSAINHALLELERSPGGSEAVGAIFRAVHTIKGMSATMGYVAVAGLSHEMETLLDGVRSGTYAVTPAMMDALFKSADALERSIELAVAEQPSEFDVSGVIARLRAAASEVRSPGPAGPPRAVTEPAVATAGSVPDGWTAVAPDGSGTLVRVRFDPASPLRGVRAFMVVERAGKLGLVTGIVPPLEQLKGDWSSTDIALRIDTPATAAEIDAMIRGAGDVEAIAIGDDPPAAAAAPTVVELRVKAETPVPAPPAESGVGTAAENAPLRAQRHVRIELRRLDMLMNLIGELVITRGRLSQLATVLSEPGLEETVGQASRLISELQDEIMHTRMVPVWQVFDRFPRLVRDAARGLGKQVEFLIAGKEIELDRSMLDEIGDPIVHLLRNAVDHGLESPEGRVATGKPATGKLTLSAARDRSGVVIRVSDDGRGIDRGKVLRRAQSLGIIDPAKLELTDDELIRLISRAGFSTAEQVTDMSGRGVGIDAVQTRVRALGGTVDIKSQPGAGTTVTVRLPLTLAIVRALLARVNGEVYAIPLSHVNETIELQPAAQATIGGRDVVVLRDEVVPLLKLRDIVQLPAATGRSQQIVVLELVDRRVGLVVDDLAGQQEIVVKQFDGVRGGLPLFSGATILGDGAPALIMDVSSLL
ncbi:MAG: chemotaxis protein CheA [Gemmatimonadaceae bacterium]